jgi:hypothetical protein
MQIGRPAHWHVPADVLSEPCFEYDLQDGDELKVGDTVFEVDVVVSEDKEREGVEEPAAEKELLPAYDQASPSEKRKLSGRQPRRPMPPPSNVSTKSHDEFLVHGKPPCDQVHAEDQEHDHREDCLQETDERFHADVLQDGLVDRLNDGQGLPLGHR